SPAAAADTRTRARHPRRRTRPRSPSCRSPPRWLASVAVVGLERFQRDPQELGNFFLESNDGFRPLQLRRQSAVLLLQRFHARIDGGLLPSACLRRQPVLALPAPGHDVRRVEALTPQQRAEFAAAGTRIGLVPE